MEKKKKIITLENLEKLKQGLKFRKLLILKTVDLIKYGVLYLTYVILIKFIEMIGVADGISFILVAIYAYYTIKFSVRFEVENYNIIVGDYISEKRSLDVKKIMHLLSSAILSLLGIGILATIFEEATAMENLLFLALAVQIITMESLVLTSGEAGHLFKKTSMITIYNIIRGNTWLKIKTGDEEVLYRRVSNGIISDYRKVFIFSTNEVRFLNGFTKIIYGLVLLFYVLTGSIKYTYVNNKLFVLQIIICVLIIILNVISYKIKSRFSNTILKQSYYNKVSFMYWLALDIITFVFILNPSENITLIRTCLVVITIIYGVLLLCIKIKPLKKKLLNKYIRVDGENFEPYNNMVMRLKTEESFNESQYQLVSALNDNESQGAVLVSGPWGSGKTFLVQNTIPTNKEVDLLKYGSGQNMFYAMFRALTNPFGSINLKLNILNFIKNPELIYILIGLNLAYVPVLALIKQPYLTDGQEINLPHISLVLIIIGVLNLVIIQILPYVVFSKDISNNRFRKMYLDLMTSQVENEVLVIENLDRLEWIEINEVLEILNYLKDNGKKVVVTADIDYLKFKYKQHLNGGKEADYASCYFNRYFKDVIYIPLSAQYKLKALLELAKKEKVFIAPYEHRLILNVLKQSSNTTIREIEGFIKKYDSRVVVNQVSYDLFLFINNRQKETSNDISTLEEPLQVQWCDILDENRKDKFKCCDLVMKPVFGGSHHIYLLLNSEYCYANIPKCNDLVKLDEIWLDNLTTPSKEEIDSIKLKGFTCLSLNEEELKLYRRVPHEDRTKLLAFLKKECITLDATIEIAQKHLETEYQINVGTVDLNNVLCAMYIDVVIEHGDIGEALDESAFSYVQYTLC